MKKIMVILMSVFIMTMSVSAISTIETRDQVLCAEFNSDATLKFYNTTRSGQTSDLIVDIPLVECIQLTLSGQDQLKQANGFYQNSK